MRTNDRYFVRVTFIAVRKDAHPFPLGVERGGKSSSHWTAYAAFGRISGCYIFTSCIIKLRYLTAQDARIENMSMV